MIPFMVVSFMICMYWDQFCALVKVGSEPARFELRTKRPPLVRGYVDAIVAAVVGTVVLPVRLMEATSVVNCFSVSSLACWWDRVCIFWVYPMRF